MVQGSVMNILGTLHWAPWIQEMKFSWYGLKEQLDRLFHTWISGFTLLIQGMADFALSKCFSLFSCDQALLRTPHSVCPSACLSVRLWHLFVPTEEVRTGHRNGERPSMRAYIRLGFLTIIGKSNQSISIHLLGECSEFISFWSMLAQFWNLSGQKMTENGAKWWFPSIIWKCILTIRFQFKLVVYTCWVSVQKLFAFGTFGQILALYWPKNYSNCVKMVVSDHYLKKCSCNSIQTCFVHLLCECSGLICFRATLTKFLPSSGVTARFVTRFNLWLRHDLWPHDASICDPARFVTKSASICDQRYTMILESKLCRGKLVFVFKLIMYTKWYNMIIYIYELWYNTYINNGARSLMLFTLILFEYHAWHIYIIYHICVSYFMHHS